MARYLIVGGETAANPEVVQEAESILARDKDAQFTLLVPATHVRQYLGQHKGEDEEVARRMAEAAERRFKDRAFRSITISGRPILYRRLMRNGLSGSTTKSSSLLIRLEGPAILP